MAEHRSWWEREITIGIIYESVRDISKPLRYMKHNAWGFCYVTIENLRCFSIYDIITDEDAPDYICVYATHKMFDSLRVPSNHNEKYETE